MTLLGSLHWRKQDYKLVAEWWRYSSRQPEHPVAAGIGKPVVLERHAAVVESEQVGNQVEFDNHQLADDKPLDHMTAEAPSNGLKI